MIRQTSAAARDARQEEHAMTQKNIGHAACGGIPAIAFDTAYPGQCDTDEASYLPPRSIILPATRTKTPIGLLRSGHL